MLEAGLDVVEPADGRLVEMIKFQIINGFHVNFILNLHQILETDTQFLTAILRAPCQNNSL